MTRNKILFTAFTLSLGCIVWMQACRKAQPNAEENEWYSGGKQTVFITGSGAYRQMFPTLEGAKEAVHETGDALFESTFNSDEKQPFYGLGPVFNNVSCSNCHIGDGRGKAPNTGEQLSSLLIRLSIAGTNPHGGPNPIPNFGGQLQQRSIFGAAAEADVQVSYTETNYQFADGENYSLRKPHYSFVSSYLPMPAGYLYSPRMATPVFGLGLLEAISEDDILKNADESDLNGDGISGKPNMVWDVLNQKKSLGRFGWKAGQPTVLQQSAGAFNEDMGVTSFVFPIESTLGQQQNSISKNKKEVSDSLMFALAFYIKTLAVPGRRDVTNAAVMQGKQLFAQVGCSNCHQPKAVTKVDVSSPESSNQIIFPYTDLLLHDMGDSLADYRPEFEANGKEWRTAALWGIGLTQLVNGHNNFLHDGRARNITEAIMWHGGEAVTAKNKFAALTKAERAAMLAFLQSL